MQNDLQYFIDKLTEMGKAMERSEAIQKQILDQDTAILISINQAGHGVQCGFGVGGRMFEIGMAVLDRLGLFPSDVPEDDSYAFEAEDVKA